MAAEALNFDLLHQLVSHHVLPDRLLGNLLDGIEGAGGLMDGLVDSPELALSQRLQQLEVVNRGLPAGKVLDVVLYPLAV
jgi:hypothetical protein